MIKNIKWIALGLLLGFLPTMLMGGAERLQPGLAVPALAAEPAAFTDTAFQAAQQAGKPILIHVNASWCPTCAQQRPILGQLEQSAELSDLVVFTVDFDSQKDVLWEFNVQQQSTLIVFHGKTEKARATGITDPAAIHDLVIQAKG